MAPPPRCPREDAARAQRAKEAHWEATNGGKTKASGESLLYPIMISNSDMLKTVWRGAEQFDNDHEGLNALAFVSKTFAMVIAFKYSSC